MCLDLKQEFRTSSAFYLMPLAGAENPADDSSDDDDEARGKIMKALNFPEVEKEQPSQMATKISKCIQKRLKRLGEMTKKFQGIGKNGYELSATQRQFYS